MQIVEHLITHAKRYQGMKITRLFLI